MPASMVKKSGGKYAGTPAPASDMDTRLTMALIFFISLSLLNFQVTLTRIFSALFTYHYAFLVISIAITGTVTGALISHGFHRRRKLSARVYGRLPLLLLLMGFSFMLGTAIIFIIPVTLTVYAYALFVLPVFILGGMLTAALFQQKSSSPQRLYFADLLGAGAGSILSLLLLNTLGVISTILLPAVAMVAAALFVQRRKRLFALLPALVLILLILLNANGFKTLEGSFKAFSNSSEGKSLWRYKASGIESRIVYTRWNAFSRTDVIDIPGFDDYKTISIDGTGNSLMYRFNGDMGSQADKKRDNPFYAYSMDKADKVVLIGSGGGGEIIYPLLKGCKDISAVEINSSTIEAVRHFKDYSGNIYDRPGVKVFAEDGRHFMSKSKEKYDVIFLSLVLTEIATQSGFMLSEDFIYTTEAFNLYFSRLSDNGRIAIVAHEEPEMYRLLATVIQVLQKRGLSMEESMNRIAVLNYTYLRDRDIPGRNDVFQPLILVKNSPITYAEAEQIYEGIASREQRILYLPYFSETGVLKDLKEGSLQLDQLLRNSDYNMHPVSDDRPYFRIFNKALPSGLTVLMVLIPAVFLAAFGQLGLFRMGGKPAGYFALLGLGFMLVEVPLISKLTLYLGHPIYGYSAGLFILLVSSGLGSLFSSRSKVLSTPRHYFPLLGIVLLTAIFTGFFPMVLYATLSHPLPWKIAIISVLLVPLGFFMGMPFPYALEKCKTGSLDISLPAVWAVNGLTSVMGSMLAVYISIYTGYSAVLWMGGALYGVLFLYLSPVKLFARA